MTSPGTIVESDFTESLAWLVEPSVARLDAGLAVIPELNDGERSLIRQAVSESAYNTAHRLACRVLVVELNAARVSGRLTAADSAARWDEFIALSARKRYWDEEISALYPGMLPRLRTAVGNRCEATLVLAQRLAADRAALASWGRSDEPGGLGGAGNRGGLGELTGIQLGAGDSHRGGHTVAILRFDNGTVVYKPRSVHVDLALADLLAEFFGTSELADVAPHHRIRVPTVLSRGDYGWAEHIAHRYCADDSETTAFYRGMGHWLAVMGLLGGTDLHAENVIAHGPVPVVVDCETLFTPTPPPSASGLGLAVDRAADLVNATVLRTGLLPGRGIALGWRGADASAIGSLPGQQPTLALPVLVDGGSDRARIGYEQTEPLTALSHPQPEPALADYWHHVVDGLAAGTDALLALDRAGRLGPLLSRFGECPIRVVTRGTETYQELLRMLWHPVSLHDPVPAEAQVTDLLRRMAEAVPNAPGDPEVIAAEIAELLVGDVPFFATTPARGRLTGPAGTQWLPEKDLIGEALGRWRRADRGLDRHVVRSALAAAYLNEGWMPAGERLPPGRAGTADLDRRRRKLAADLVRRVRDTALRAEDGTVAWIAPVLGETGWSVRPLTSDLYAGLPGVAVLLAVYLRQVASGLADPVSGLEDVRDAALRTTRRMEDLALSKAEAQAESQTIDPERRGALPGGYVGLASQIWAWQMLRRLDAAPDGYERARALAATLPAATGVDAPCELLTGTAGAIVPLLALAESTGERRWIDQAVAIGDSLVAAARRREGTAYWPSERFPDGLGGFAHGVTGIGWALARLALFVDGGAERFGATARAAFAFDEALYDPSTAGWEDKRDPGFNAAAWCHGAVGIGLAGADLSRRGWPVAPDLLRRAASAADRQGFGWNHTACHGDTGAWEVLDAAFAAGCAPDGLDPIELRARIVASLENNGTITGLTRAVFSPGLLAGGGGVAYQLLRMDSGSDLPSLLLQETLAEH